MCSYTEIIVSAPLYRQVNDAFKAFYGRNGVSYLEILKQLYVTHSHQKQETKGTWFVRSVGSNMRLLPKAYFVQSPLGSSATDFTSKFV